MFSHSVKRKSTNCASLSFILMRKQAEVIGYMSRDVWARSRSRSGRLVLFSMFDVLCVHKYKSVLHIARWYNWCKSIRPRKTATETRRCRLKHLYGLTCSRASFMNEKIYHRCTTYVALVHVWVYKCTNVVNVLRLWNTGVRMCFAPNIAVYMGQKCRGDEARICDAQDRIRVSVERICKPAKRTCAPVALCCVNNVWKKYVQLQIYGLQVHECCACSQIMKHGCANVFCPNRCSVSGAKVSRGWGQELVMHRWEFVYL